MKYIYALLISLFLPTVVFAQSVPVSWLRNVASGFLTPLNINDSVGIGTVSPQNKLEISGTSAGATLGLLRLSNIGVATSTGARLLFTTKDSGNFNLSSTIDSIATDITLAQGKSDLVFSVTNIGSLVERMRILSSGNVGIGSTTPVSQLTVQKTIVSDVDYPALSLSRDDTTNALGDSLGDIDFWSNDASTDGPGIGSRIRGVVDDVAGRSYGLSLWTRSGGAGTPISEKMRIASDGKVGIGTTTPRSRLQISEAGSAILTLHRVDSAINPADEYGSIDWYTNEAQLTGSAAVATYIKGVAPADVPAYNTPNPYGELQFGVSNNTAVATAMTLARNGNLGIGTTTPAVKLSVVATEGQPAGVFYTDSTGRGFRVGTSDYVFGGSKGTFMNIGLLNGTGVTKGTIQAQQGGSFVDLLLNPSGGNVGVGTTSPFTTLSVVGDGWFENGSTKITVKNSANSVKTEYASNSIQSYNSNLFINTTGNNVIFSASSNIGIGTTTPWTRLAVTGSTTIAGGPLIVLGSANTPISADTDWYRQFGLFRKDINDYAFTTFENRNGGSNASVDLLWNNDRTTALSYYANLGFNSSAFNNPAFGNLNVANAWYGYNTDGPILWATATTSTAGYFDVTTGGYSSSRMRITSTGNVGIGTTTPDVANISEKLVVTGDIFINNIAFNSGMALGMIGGVPYIQGANAANTGVKKLLLQPSGGSVGIGTTTPQSTLSVGSVNDATNSYAQIDSVNGAPTAGDCDTDLERGRMIIDYSNNRFYICNGATRGWDYSALTD